MIPSTRNGGNRNGGRCRRYERLQGVRAADAAGTKDYSRCGRLQGVIAADAAGTRMDVVTAADAAGTKDYSTITIFLLSVKNPDSKR